MQRRCIAVDVESRTCRSRAKSGAPTCGPSTEWLQGQRTALVRYNPCCIITMMTSTHGVMQTHWNGFEGSSTQMPAERYVYRLCCVPRSAFCQCSLIGLSTRRGTYVTIGMVVRVIRNARMWANSLSSTLLCFGVDMHNMKSAFHS